MLVELEYKKLINCISKKEKEKQAFNEKNDIKSYIKLLNKICNI